MNIAICSAGELFGGVERQILDLYRFYGRMDLPTPLVILFNDRVLAAKLREQGVEPVVLRGRSRYDWSLIGQVAHVFTERAVVLSQLAEYLVSAGDLRGAADAFAQAITPRQIDALPDVRGQDQG